MITDSFDDKTEPLISLSEFYGEPKEIVDTCLIIFSKVIYDYLLEKYTCEVIAKIGGCNGKNPIYRLLYNHLEIAFYLSPIGSTGAAQTCVEANWLTGAKQYIMFGSCGSLNKEITSGKFIIPTEAYRDEGMSYHYAPARDYIKITNSNKLAQIFAELQIPHVQGRIWTTDAMLRETKGQAEQRRNEGCIAVEMEVAGVQAVCDFYGFQLYNFLAAGDVLMANEYQVKELTEANHNLDKLFIALEIATKI